MQFSERELEDWFFENPKQFIAATSCCCGKFYWIGRQVQVPSGIIDLLGICGCREWYPTLYVVELKADQLRSSAIGQVVRYSKDISQALDEAAEDGVYNITQWCIGVGSIRDDVQYEADALDVQLLTVEHTYAVRGPWTWTEEKLAKDGERITAVATNIAEHIQNVCVPMEVYRKQVEANNEVIDS